MINLPVSEAYAWDYLAILTVKLHWAKLRCPEQDIVSESLYSQLGHKLYYNVQGSAEYKELLDANLSVWAMVDLAVKDECKASSVDSANQRRYAAKRALQERFWPSSPLMEVKSPRPNDLIAISKEPTVQSNGGG